ncbi:unnamed protein product [Lactuca virosa]|uniref:Uncharacterized protein n=1 Tax=Lactuca virosa TaxID=75947 RepID=A0AAU9NF67_9ASTR|nr:unnamed protein product [Lactuca virosa]
MLDQNSKCEPDGFLCNLSVILSSRNKLISTGCYSVMDGNYSAMDGRIKVYSPTSAQTSYIHAQDYNCNRHLYARDQ